jgi:hypothetical protein
MPNTVCVVALSIDNQVIYDPRVKCDLREGTMVDKYVAERYVFGNVCSTPVAGSKEQRIMVTRRIVA